MTDFNRDPFSGIITKAGDDTNHGIADRLKSALATGEAAAGDFVEKARNAWSRIVEEGLKSLGDQ